MKGNTVRIKSYFADSVVAAMREARSELGEEALLLQSRRVRSASSGRNAYEVVFGVHSSRRTPANSGTARETGPQHDSGFRLIPSASGSKRLRALRAKLTGFELDESVAAGLLARIDSRLLRATLDARRDLSEGCGVNGDDLLERVIAEEVDGFFPRDLGFDGDAGGQVFALFGPPGSGKTSAIVRLAVQHGIAPGRRTLLLATQDPRVEGNEKLARYAALLGAEYSVAATPESVGAILDKRAADDFVLIDTPGLAPRELEPASDMAALLSGKTDIQRHLVLPATMKRSDLRDNVRLFSRFQPDRLSFTRLDETSRLGPILSEAAESGIPISFLTSGQQVPGNLQWASGLRLSRLLQSPEQAPGACAA